MPGDTKIKRTTNGWIDIDNPSNAYRTRWQARDARRGAVAHRTRKTTRAVATATTTVSVPQMTSLQTRLYERLINRQGVTTSEAKHVIENFGYNAAASYGHMREAGATNDEALEVIALGKPFVSVAYGQSRYYGFDHTFALAEALDANDD